MVSGGRAEDLPGVAVVRVISGMVVGEVLLSVWVEGLISLEGRSCDDC